MEQRNQLSNTASHGELRSQRCLCLFRARKEVTEVYGELTDLDSIDWMKISNVDVSYDYHEPRFSFTVY